MMYSETEAGPNQKAFISFRNRMIGALIFICFVAVLAFVFFGWKAGLATLFGCLLITLYVQSEYRCPKCRSLKTGVEGEHVSPAPSLVDEWYCFKCHHHWNEDSPTLS